MGMTTKLNDPSIDRQIQHHTNQSHTLHVFFPSNIPVKEWREFVSIEYSTTFEDYPPSLAVSRQYLKWPKHLAWFVPPTVKQYRPPSVWSLPQPFQQVDTCLPSKWLAKTHTEKEFLKKCIIQNIYCILLITYLVEFRTKHRTADACSCSFLCMAPEGLEP